MLFFWDIIKENGDTNHIIFKTKDEGENWEKVAVIIHPYFWSQTMKFIDNKYGYIVGETLKTIGMQKSNVIYRTKDGGNSWQKVLDTIVPWNAWGIQEIDILDRKSAIATSQFGVVYWTHDSGDSWQLDSNGLLREDIPARLYPSILGKHTALIADFLDRITRSSLKPKDIKEVEDYLKTTGEMIYPNPATDFITINISQGSNKGLKPFATNDMLIEIYDVMGMIVMSDVQHLGDVGHLKKIDISNLSPGVYFVKIVGSNGDSSIVEKFVKI